MKIDVGKFKFAVKLARSTTTELLLEALSYENRHYDVTDFYPKYENERASPESFISATPRRTN